METFAHINFLLLHRLFTAISGNCPSFVFSAIAGYFPGSTWDFSQLLYYGGEKLYAENTLLKAKQENILTHRSVAKADSNDEKELEEVKNIVGLSGIQTMVGGVRLPTKRLSSRPIPHHWGPCNCSQFLGLFCSIRLIPHAIKPIKKTVEIGL